MDGLILFSMVFLVLWFRAASNIGSLRLISTGFALITLGQTFSVAGDVLMAMGYTPEDTWILTRPWRGLTWRTGSAIGFTIIVLVLRHGRFKPDGRN